MTVDYFASRKLYHHFNEFTVFSEDAIILAECPILWLSMRTHLHNLTCFFISSSGWLILLILQAFSPNVQENTFRELKDQIYFVEFQANTDDSNWILLSWSNHEFEKLILFKNTKLGLNSVLNSSTVTLLIIFTQFSLLQKTEWVISVS